MARRPVRGEAAQRWGSIAVAAAVFGLVSWLTVESTDPRPVKAPSADAGSEAGSSTTVAASAASADDAGASEPSDGGLHLEALSLGDAAVVPTTGGPRSVRIGVVLVNWNGAEGAPANARSKQDARALAEKLLGDARSDFHQAVSGGDSGSADDIGRLGRGVLDPRTEAAVFALGSGDVSEILETARGYWIVKRLD